MKKSSSFWCYPKTWLVWHIFIMTILPSEAYFKESRIRSEPEFLSNTPYRNSVNGEASQKPNIIIILADDMGWNDVSFHGSDQIPTPNIDALAYSGVILNNHYVAPICTPSRAALMTGKYPIHNQMQHSALLENEPRGLPLEEKILPQYFKEAGYNTHIVGKWHLGYFKREYTPTFRGFDSHFGYWQGLQDYYTHQVRATEPKFRDLIGFDMRRNMSTAWDTVGKYSTDLFTEEAVRLISTHDKKNPMLLYLSHLAPHSGLPEDQYQAPAEVVEKFSYIQDPLRRTYAAMVSKLDESVGKVVSALKTARMLDNSIILFMSDNGAPTTGLYHNSGSNYPLRGIKGSFWEGAVRGVAAIWSPLIQEPRRVSNDLIHITDWLPTLLSAAGMCNKIPQNIDGKNLWPTLVSGALNPRRYFLVNIDPIDNYLAYRYNEFKLVSGRSKSGSRWQGETGRSYMQETEGTSPSYDPQEVMMSEAGQILLCSKNGKSCTRPLRRPDGSMMRTCGNLISSADILKLRKQAEVNCNMADHDKIPCDPMKSPCLFDIVHDPCEQRNIAELEPSIVQDMLVIFRAYNVTMLPPNNMPGDPWANPKFWNDVWVPWKDD